MFPNKRFWLGVGLIVFLGAILRVFRLGNGVLSGDEAVTAIRSFWVSRGLLTQTLVHFYGLIVSPRPPGDIISLVPAITFGLNEASARTFGVVVSLISIVAAICALKNVLPLRQGLLVSLLLAVSPICVGWSRLATADSLEIAGMILLLVTAIRFLIKPDDKQLLALSIVYGFCLWVMETFLVLGPFLAGLVLINYKKGLTSLIKSSLVFSFIVGVVWVPRFIGGLFVPGSLGTNYQLSGVHFPDIVANSQYYLQTYFLYFPVLIPTIIVLIGLLVKKVRTDKVYQVSLGMFASLVTFFVFVYWKHQAYLGSASIPLLMGAARACFLMFPKKTATMILVVFASYLLFTTGGYLLAGESKEIAVWGFRKPSEIAKAAYLVRKCTSKESKIISDIDGYATSLYFDRKYFGEQDKIGLAMTLKNFASAAGAVYLQKYVSGVDYGNKTPIKFSDGSVLYIFSCQYEPSMVTAEKFYKEFLQTPNAISFYR